MLLGDKGMKNLPGVVMQLRFDWEFNPRPLAHTSDAQPNPLRHWTLQWSCIIDVDFDDDYEDFASI